MAEISLGLSFDDVLLQPALSAVLPGEADLSTHVTAGIPLHIPVVSAAMDTVSETELAIALAGHPRLLLMDEPTAGMAPAERLALMDLVRELAASESITVLFTEHSMDVVFRFARRILVLSRGRLIADGAPEAVRNDPAAQAAYFGEEAA